MTALLLAFGLAAVAAPPTRSAAPVTDVAVRTVAARSCPDVSFSDVEGRAPRYLPKRLTDYWGRGAVCRGRWLGDGTGNFVPQSVMVTSSTVWVSGYDPRDTTGSPCRILRLDRSSLALKGQQNGLIARVPDGSRVYCGHAGGIVQQGSRLWVSDTYSMWLLDPTRVGRTGVVRKVWRLTGATRGSTVVLHPSKGLGLGTYSDAGQGRITWYDPDRLAGARSGTMPAPTSVQGAPDGLQGLAYGRLRSSGVLGLWMSLTHSGCAVVKGPRGQRAPLAPSIEGLSLVGGAWVSSEATVRQFWQSGDPVIPQLMRYSKPELGALAASPDGQRRADACLAR